jgi:hypothetical protein
MKQILNKILDLFKLKSPCCNSTMESIGEFNGSQIHECNKCKKEFI